MGVFASGDAQKQRSGGEGPWLRLAPPVDGLGRPDWPGLFGNAYTEFGWRTWRQVPSASHEAVRG